MNCYLSKNYKGTNNAGNKAKTDVEKIMDTLGFRNIGFRQTRYKNSLISFLVTFLSVLRCVILLRKGDTLVLQYPLRKYYSFICHIARLKKCKIITLIHDLGSFRRKKLTVAQEINRLNLSDSLIVHSENMKQWLIERGYRGDLEVLEVFDYLSTKSTTVKLDTPQKPYRVLFAGVLKHRLNPFLYEVANNSVFYKMVLCGSSFEEDRLLNKNNVIYRGYVDSEELISNSEAEFGLVWYGSITLGDAQKNGEFDEYLHYNAPHKLSLYIRSGLPVIIWQKGALADYIQEKNIGICLNSLAELDDILATINTEQYLEMKANVIKESKKLASGHYFSHAINNACEKLGGFDLR